VFTIANDVQDFMQTARAMLSAAPAAATGAAPVPEHSPAPPTSASGGTKTIAGREERRGHRFRQTRGHILAAARDVMLETGPARLSLREVARRAHFSPAALYKYFASRDEIIAELTAESLRRLQASLDGVPAGQPADERLVALGLAYMRFAEENPADLRCILAVAADGRAAKTDSPLAMGVEMAGLLGETLREGVRSGLFRPLTQAELTRAAFACWSLVHGMAALASVDLEPVRGQVRSDPEGVLRDFVRSLRGGPDDRSRGAAAPVTPSQTVPDG
jgi:AcrR family transcriptional regulator